MWAQSDRTDDCCGAAAHKKAPPAGEQEALGAKGAYPVRSALNAVFEHLAGGEGGNLLGGDGDLFAGLGVQALTSGALTGFEGAETKDGNFFPFDNGIKASRLLRSSAMEIGYGHATLTRNSQEEHRV